MAANESSLGIDLGRLQGVVDKFQADEGKEYEVVGRVERREKVGGDMLVLDSSFNPPTRAHMGLILSSLQPTLMTDGVGVGSPRGTGSGRDSDSQPTRYSRVLLLLAVQNADKAPKPAAFPDRLAMMLLFANDLVHRANRHACIPTPPVEVGIIKHARFLDKAISLRKAYPGTNETIFLTGFDTLIRLFDAKYYGGTLTPLAPFFDQGNSIRCCFRPVDAGAGGWKKEQERYLEDIREGKREGEGCKREWGHRVEMLEHGLESPVSSTLVREAVVKGDEDVLSSMLTEGVKKWVLGRRLYMD